MTALSRQQVKIFASNALSSQVTAFRTTEDESPTFSKVPDILQSEKYATGWLNADNTGNVAPHVEDFNGLFLTSSYLTAYLYEKGIPEYLATQVYYRNSFCQYQGDLYRCKVDNTLNYLPTDTSKWDKIATEEYTASNIGTGDYSIYAGTNSAGTEFQFKKLIAGTNVTMSETADSLTISSTPGAASFSASAPLSYSDGVLSISKASSNSNGYLSSADWTSFNSKLSGTIFSANNSWTGTNTFSAITLGANDLATTLAGKQTQLNGTGFVKANGTTISYDNTSYIPLSGSASISGDLRPATTNVYAVGGANAYWKQGCFTNLYSSHGYIQKITSSSALILGGSGVVQLYANSNTTNSLYYNSTSIYPGGDNIIEVGKTDASYTSMWSYCYKVRNNSSQYPAVGEYGIIADIGYLDLCGRGGTNGGVRIWGLNNAHLGTWDNQGVYTRASGTLGTSTYRWGRTYLAQGAPLDLNGTLIVHESTGNERSVIKRTVTSGGIFIFDSDEVGVRLAHGSTSWATASDRRQKRDIVSLEDSLNTVNALNPIRFNYKEEKEDAPTRVGFVAQEVREVIPEAVTGEETETEFLAVSMTEIIPFMVKAIQELTAKVSDLEKQLEAKNGN